MDEITRALEELDFLIGKWNVCQSCRVIDNDQARSRVGSKCRTCGAESDGGHAYFVMSVYTLVDLIKEAYTTEHKIENKGTSFEYKINTHHISVLLYFCTLREVLMHGLIRELCIAQKIPKGVYERLNSDNKLYSQKQNKLFPSLTGVKWVEALQELENETSKEYINLNEMIVKFIEHRNKFVHQGHRIFDIDESIAKDCILNIELLVSLYIDLHNKFVHTIYRDNNNL